MEIAIRVDGGPDIGFGHLVRTSALAERLCDDGHDITVATTTLTSAEAFYPTACSFVEVPTRDDPGPFLDRIEKVRPVAVVTDAYPVDTIYQRAVREQFPLAVIDDDARHAVCADIVINGNLYAPRLNYEFRGAEPRWCLGSDYLLLRDAIVRLAEREPPWRETPQRAIVTMGGSDIADVTPAAIRAFDGLSLRVDAIVGPGFSDRQERVVRAAAEQVTADVTVARDPNDLPERMFRADFAVCTASSTTYELLALGTPVVAVPVATNQQPIVSALRDRDAGTVLNRAETAQFRDAIRTYLEDPSLRRTRRERGRTLVDGRGAQRTAAVITEFDGN